MLRWIDGERFTLHGTEFVSFGDGDFNDVSVLQALMRTESTAERFSVWKGRDDIDHYMTLLDRLEAKRVVELGILKGGSTAFLVLAANPDKLVAIDIVREPVAALEEFLGTRGLAERVKTFYGVDQGDSDRLERLLSAEFGAGTIDLVVDDASHRLDLTRASFNVLFPRLRPGGVYVIEDWSWAHAVQSIDLTHLGPPLTNLVFEIVVACAAVPGAIENIEIKWGAAYITRGPAELDAGFDVAEPLRVAGMGPGL